MKTIRTQLDVLFVSETPLWPLDQGFRIRGSNMSKALVNAGLKVGTACMGVYDVRDIHADMRDRQLAWPAANDEQLAGFDNAWSGAGGWLRKKLASHQGVDLEAMAGVRALVKKHRPRVVVALGQHGPMFLRGIKDLNCQCVWYAADEPVRFQLSCMTREPMRNWRERLRQAAFYAAVEFAFVRGIDGAIGVSPLDAKLLKWIGGACKVAMIRNGVDLDYFCPADAADAATKDVPGEVNTSLVFWGRLDFEPNIDAVLWFGREVWPVLIEREPRATWTIVGKFPGQSVRELAAMPGVTLSENVPDIRPFAHEAGLTILPMRCGGGIKNKLLEAAAMGLPVVVSPRAIQGLELQADYASDKLPVHVCATSQAWVDDILSLWQDADRRQQLGDDARQWVLKQHSWAAAAKQFCEWIGMSASNETYAKNSAVKTIAGLYSKEAA